MRPILLAGANRDDGGVRQRKSPCHGPCEPPRIV